MDSPPHTKGGLRKILSGNEEMGIQMEGEADDMEGFQPAVPVVRSDMVVHTTFFNTFQDDFDDDDLA
ncbi:hypothetical protein DYB32_004793 [Aphanomyces invadans]|uniref:Uncharacterized protein n=1 Tax=Aphanomyces invadans TaxID=157072 RepID=A0A418AWB0_9STRA|nr:hypothetical protein DYB32_004793 [Aphanomyces invadans]